MRASRVASHSAEVPVSPCPNPIQRVLAELFPAPAERAPRPTPNARRAALTALVYAVALGAGAVILLLREAGTPPWRGLYAEDLPVYLVQPLAHPWSSLLTGYAGYLQLVPRVIGQAVSLLLVPDAAAAFALSGAAIASGCALLVFHASSGHLRSPVSRALLGLSVLLLPVAPLEIINSTVNAPWYLNMALFWALLWRPPSARGKALAALIGFAAASSNTTAFVLAVLVVARVVALPRLREQAVSLGWAAGCLVEVPFLVHSGSSRLGSLASPGQTVAFFGHDVVLPAFGWHASWLLRDAWGANYALILVGGLLTLAVGLILVTGTQRVRLFATAALGVGFLFTVFSATITWWVTIRPVSALDESGSRYTCLPILLITATVIVAADTALAGRRRRVVIAGTLALIAVLCIGWVPDYRYMTGRDSPQPWAPTLSSWLQTCRHSEFVGYPYPYDNHTVFVIPCSRIRG